MRDANIVLSISMLVSGREEMEKSLVSLRFFREAFPCEVILVDTGCSENYRAIAEKYADQIVDFTWCDDFAAARNAGLKEARGEWFLYLDDDEWFEDPQQIVAFFTSGEYKRYGSASYVQRNYKDREGTLYSDSYPVRMARLTPETRFEGKIHEYLAPYEKPCKEFTDFVHHYGYVYKDAEDQKRHAKRNIKPLLELMGEQPGEPRWVCQLAQEYLSIHEYEDVFSVCEKGLTEWRQRAERENFSYVPSHVGGLYVYLLIALEVLRRFEEEEEWLQRAFADPNMLLANMEPTLAFLNALGAKLYHNLKNYRKCSEYLRRYVEYTKRFRDDRDILQSAALIVSSVFQVPFVYPLILDCLGSAVRAADESLTEDAFYLLDWQSEGLLRQNKWEEDLLDAFCGTEYSPVWTKLLQTLISRPEGADEMLAVLKETEKRYRQQGEAIGKKKLSRLRRLMAELDFEHSDILCARILRTEEEPGLDAGERRQKMEILFTELFDKYESELLEINADIWDAAERCGLSPESYLLRIRCHSWKRMLERWRRRATLSEIKQWEERIGARKGPIETAVYYGIFDIKCAEGYLRCGQEDGWDLVRVEEVLWRYAGSVLALYENCFQETVRNEMPELLPEELQLALLLEEQRTYREEGDDLKALECAKKCLNICTALGSEMTFYAKLLRDDVQERERQASQAQTELQRLIATLKATARAQIEQGEYQAAREILLQIRQCAPEDGEVGEMLAQLSGQGKGSA